MKKIDFVFFDAGGGHRSAATALKTVIEAQQRPWEVRLVNLQEVLDDLDVFRKITGVRMQDIYNLVLKHGLTLGSPQATRLMQAIIRIHHPAQVGELKKFWLKSRPDLVVSLIPNFNRSISQSLEQTLPHVPRATILTDLADFPPHFWIEKSPQYYVCGSDKAVEQARAHGHPDRHIFRASGMILNPRFYEPVTSDRAQERSRLGLDAGLPTGLVLFGGQGSHLMTEIAERLDRSGLKLQLILVCGHNQGLAAKLHAARFRVPVYVEGFTREIPYYMHLSDFFIGKPGPGSISEALAMKLPVIVERNAWTLPQERYNADYLLEKQVGVVLKSFRDLVPAVTRLLDPERFRACRANAEAIRNQAVFEIPGMLEQILERGPAK